MDELLLEPQELSALHLGDVVVFEQSKSTVTITVVHRIVSKNNSRWLTRGDNNLPLDSAPLSTETFVGLVVSLQRRGHTRPVLKGFSSWLCANCLFFFKGLWFQTKRLLLPLYALLYTAHLAHPLWKPAFATLTLQTEELGTLIKTLYRSRTVARYWPATGAYHCRKPFDLVLVRPARPSRTFDDEAPCHQPR